MVIVSMICSYGLAALVVTLAAVYLPDQGEGERHDRCSLVMGNQVDRAVFVRLTRCYCWVRSSLRGTHPLLVFTMQPTNAA